MDADQYELVFHRKGGSFVAVDAHANPAREEFFDGKRAGKIAQREIIVQLDDQLRVSLGEKILPGNFAGINGTEGNGCLVTCSQQGFCGAADVSLADKEVEIADSCAWWDRHRPAWQVLDL